MGMEKHVSLPNGPPPWRAVADAVARAGCPVQMRMIDGELALPDEEPPADWRELRVAHSGAMLTIRRGEGEVVLVGWGNADDTQRRLWDALAEAFVSAGR